MTAEPATLRTMPFGLLACWLAGIWLGPDACAQSVQGKAEKPQLAPTFSAGVGQAPIVLQPQNTPGRQLPSLAGAAAPAGSGMPTIKCRLPVQQIGNLVLNDAMALIENGSIDIRAQYMPSTAEPLLRGRVIRLDEGSTTSGALRTISGLVLFHSGQMLGQLNESDMEHAQWGAAPLPVDEFIFRKNGSLSGHIVSVSQEQMVVRARAGITAISLDSVSYVRSPRAFLFTIAGTPSPDLSHTRVRTVTFQPTVSAQALGNGLVIGHPADDLLDDDLLPGPQIPAIMNRFRQLQSDNLSPMPGPVFPSWP